MTREKMILARIRVENGGISVCADEQLSMSVRDQMLAHPWALPDEPEYERDNHLVGMETHDHSDLKGMFNEPEYILPPKLHCEADLEDAFNNKDIMWKIPQDTKFRFIKRIVNRVLRLTNRYQQQFNNAVYRILYVLTDTLEWVKDGLVMTDDKANRALKKADAYAEEQRVQWQEWIAFTQEFNKWKNNIDDLISTKESQLEELLKQRIEYAASIEAYGKKIEQAELALQELKNQGSYCTESLGSHSFRIEQAEQTLQGLKNQGAYCTEALGSHSFRIEQVEQTLQGLKNQTNYNSEQLSDQSFRITNTEKKVERIKTSQIQGSADGSFSQSGEDVIVDYILNRFGILPSEVTYLDLGANHAKYLSNTYYFYQRNSKGVLVEANPELIPELEQNRRGDLILNRCVAEKSGERVRFYIANQDGLSSASMDALEEACEETSDIHLEKTVEVDTISVNDLFANYFKGNPTFVNMDLEGIEMTILQSIDFDKYRPLIYIIETIPFRNTIVIGEKEKNIVSYMKSKGYAEYAFTGINSIFVDEKQLKKQ